MRLFSLIFTVMGLSSQLQAQTCTQFAYQVISNAGTPSDLIQLNLAVGISTNINTAPNPTSLDGTSQINAIGFSRIDNQIYGSKLGTNNIVRVLTNGTLVDLGPVTGYINANVGDVDANGYYYSRRGGLDGFFTVVDVNPNRATYLKVVNPATGFTQITSAPYTTPLSINFVCADWAFSPIDGQLYSVGDNKRLYRINPLTGVVTDLGLTTGLTNTTNSYGAQFFDGAGFFYVLNNDDGIVFRFNLLSATPGQSIRFSKSFVTEGNDGARCATAPIDIDYGDAPNANYLTTLAGDGPRHSLANGTGSSALVRLGAAVTSEPDALTPLLGASDSDDGVASLAPVPSTGNTYSTTVAVTNSSTAPATLAGWIDFNNDNLFTATERAFVTVPAGYSGPVVLTWTVPATVVGATYARFRISTDDDDTEATAGTQGWTTNPTSGNDGRGLADGEVEDYAINIVLSVNISGTVFNDANGITDNQVDGTAVSSLAGNTFYANLVSASGTVLQSTTLTNGTFTFSGVTPNTSYSVVLTNTPGTVGSPPPATTLTGGVVNTGEFVGGTGSDGAPNGVVAVTVAGVSVTNVKFGVDRQPVVVAATDTPRQNPGGSVTSPVSQTVFSGSDPEEGNYANNLNTQTVRLNPATGGTLYYNGTPVTSTTLITNFNRALVTVDPTSPGSTTVTFTYAVRDNANVESAPQTITVPFTVPVPFTCSNLAYQVAGALNANSTLYSYDVATGTRAVIAELDRDVNTLAYNPLDNLLWATDNTTSNVLRIDATGAITNFDIPNLPDPANGFNVGAILPGGYFYIYLDGTARYYVVDLDPSRTTYLQLVEPTPGGYVLDDTAPFGKALSQSLNITDWVYNSSTGTLQGIVNPGSFRIFNINPTTGAVTLSAPVSGAGIQSENVAFGAAFSDATGSLYVFANGQGRFYRINLATSEATLVSNTPSALNNDGANCPTAILVPTIDLSGNVLNDANGLTDNTVNGTGVNGPALPVYVSLVQSGTIIATVPVTPTGTYSFTNVAPGSYSVVLTNNSAGSATPSVPTSYTSTGENIGTGTGSDGTPDGILAVTIVSGTPVSNANFGIQQVPVPFTCSNLAYQVAGPLGQNSNLFSYNVSTGVRTLIAPLGTEVNAIGYNPVDNLIWGYNRNTNQVIRIDATGATTNFTIPNLPVLPYFVGTVLPGGYLVIGGGGGRYYTVDINPARPTYLQLVDPTAGYVLDNTAPFGNAISNPQGFSDYAYNPATGLIQGIVDGDAASNPRRLFSLDPTTGVLTLGPTATGGGNIGAENGAFGAVFVDATGFLYAFGNESGKFFRINPSTGGTTLVSTSTPSENNDGASCPTAVLVGGTTLSGNVLNDANGLLGTPANTVDGPGVNGPALPVYVSLVQSGTVVATVPVTATGTYSFTGVAPGSYSVVLTTNSAGSATPSVPTNYTSTGENIGTTPGNDGTPDGILTVTLVSGTPVTDANFGIEQRPVGVATTDSPRTNPGGTITSPVSSSVFAGTDPEDGTYPNNLTGRTVTLTPATNGTLFYGGTPVTSTTAITNFDPTLVSIDPTAPGATTGNDPTFTYSVTDNAGVPSLPQTITVPFTANCLLAVNLTVSPNVCIGATITLSASTTGATGTVTYTFTGPNGFSVVTTASSVSVASAVLSATGAYTVVVTDASSCSATASATITVINCTSLSGNVLNDTDALTDNTVDGPGVNGPNLPVYVSLVQNGTVVATQPVSSTGGYTFTDVAPGSYSVVITTNPAGSATPSVPTNYTSTGENVGTTPGNDGTPDGILAVTVGGSPVTDVNFGIEQLPTAGSGSVTVSNPGGTTGIPVPPASFTSTTPSTDPSPGTVASIRITAFPTNTTSLTINGTPYTPTSPEFSGPTPTGVIVATDGSGTPTVPILVDPTNDSAPVSIPFKAIDNGGKESPNTGTAVLNPAPDLTPVIFARPSTVYNTTTMTVVVDVHELLNVPTSGLITVKVSKDALFTLNFDQMATSINGRPVQNTAWTYAGFIGGMYTFTTNNVIAGNVGTGKLSFGMTGTLTPGATTGTLTVSSTIMGGSGGEIRIDNNNDADKIDYFQQ